MVPARPKGFEPLTSGLETLAGASAPASKESQAVGKIRVGTTGRVHGSRRFATRREILVTRLLPALVFGSSGNKRRKLSTGLGSPRPTPFGTLAEGTVLLTVKETAKLLGVCQATAYAMVARGEIEHVRVSNMIRIVVHYPGDGGSV